jgi:hypothetical protein
MKTDWGYEYLKQAVFQERVYLGEMIRELPPESHMAVALRDMRDRFRLASEIAAAESRTQARFWARSKRSARPSAARRGGFLREWRARCADILNGGWGLIIQTRVL